MIYVSLLKGKVFVIFLLPTFILLTLLSYSCGPSVKFVEIEDPETKIKKGCFSFSLPKDEKWYVNKHWATYSPLITSCDDDLRLVSGGGNNVHHIYIEGHIVNSWKDEYSTEYFMYLPEKYHAVFLNDSRITVIDYEKEVCKNIKEICVKGYYKLSTTERLPNFDTGDAKLNPSTEYFYETLSFFIFYGPYKQWSYGTEGYYINYVYTIESTNDISDPELESKAYEI